MWEITAAATLATDSGLITAYWEEISPASEHRGSARECHAAIVLLPTSTEGPTWSPPEYRRGLYLEHAEICHWRSFRFADNSAGISSLASCDASACADKRIDAIFPNDAVWSDTICFGIGRGFPLLPVDPCILSLCEVADSLSPLVKKHCTRRPVRSMMRRRIRARALRLAARSQPNAQVQENSFEFADALVSLRYK